MDDVEEIKRLKARYCRYLDTKRWDDWRGLLTDDFVSDTSAAGGTRRGRLADRVLQADSAARGPFQRSHLHSDLRSHPKRDERARWSGKPVKTLVMGASGFLGCT